jgi:hypothetical protein
MRVPAVRCPELLLAALCMIFTIAVYYPGYMSPDSVVMLGQARNGVTTNVYSPLMSYCWRLMDHIIPGPGGMLIFQNIVYWLAIGILAYSATLNRLLRCLFVASGLSIPNFAMLGTLWKDVGMEGFLIASVAGSLYGVRLRRLWPLAVAAAALFFACGYRQNAIVVAPPLIAIMLFCLSQFHAPPPRIAKNGLVTAYYAFLGGGVLMLILAGLYLLNSYKMQDAKLWSAAMVHDLVGISAWQNANYLPEYLNRNGLTADDLKHIYSPLHANSLFIPSSRKILGVENPSEKVLSYTLTDEQARDLQFYWFTTVLDHFGSYLHHRLLMADRLLVLRSRQPWYPYITGIDPNPFGLTFHRSPLNAFMTKATEYAAFGTPWYSAWAYYLVVTLCAIVSFFWHFRYARVVQWLAASVWLYLASIFMFGMSGDFRYNIWGLACAPLCVFLLLCGATPAGGADDATRWSGESLPRAES